MPRLIVPFPSDADMADDDSVVENFFDSVDSYLHRHVHNTDRSIAETDCPEIEVCQALFYEAQINNGGHIQFVCNTDDDEETYRAVASGLMHVGARRHLAVLLDFVEWRRGNPALMHGMIGKPDPYRGPHRPFFDRFDDAFFAESEAPISRYAADWIRSSVHVAQVPIEEYLDYKAGRRSHTLL
ncbi:DMP19 family protein [Methylobacterium indicum]|uniref:DNA mimic protein DMP19 C-terminal domain-containing protein n=1 Tax=Methylobacterium indicum TaxID=1775910 RepID=A0ABR5HGG0_9HYPH|nr:DUF4375 domain-containing protein [Methylobacterium indicum]KMO17415.1 hypothetical protein QR78_17610 [Methylobacterium indicum]KMO25730.1 hypothetical protein QR79_06305 [Methylobacterium indicum]